MNRKVLIVSDNVDRIESLQRALIREGVDVSVARSADECIRVLPALCPDVVLLEDDRPRLDGFASCQKIKAEPGNELLLVILLLGEGAPPEDRVRGYRMGAVDCLSKNSSYGELVAKLQVLFRLEGAFKALGEARSVIQRHNNKLERLVRARTAEIVAARDVTVFSLAKLAESRDPETGEHLERMQKYARILAQHLAKNGPYTEVIDEDFLDDLDRSCPLHDIGKVGIPDVILLKPAKLTVEEFEVMKTHTIIGAEALEMAMERSGTSVGFLTMAAEIARCHHERYNGTGYLAGLKRDEIPLSARIVALADMFDALTCVRVYKDAFEPELARKMILDEDGKHFDPAIVEAFRATYPEFVEICHLYAQRGEEHVDALEDSTLLREVIGQ